MKLLLATTAILIVLPSSITGSLLHYEPEALESDADICNGNNLRISQVDGTLRTIGRGVISSTTLTCISIQNNDIESVAPGAFDDVPNLKYLNLHKNKINLRNLFNSGGHMNLRQLILSNQNFEGSTDCISYSEPFVIENYPELRYLDLKKTGICSLSNDLENSMPKLTALDLSNNNIVSLPTLPKSLRDLYLDGNKISTPNLINLYNLTTLTLDDNGIEYVSAGHCQICLNLSSMSNLRYFSLASNPIKTIHSISFRDMINLKYLNLSSNTLNTIKYGTFDSLLSLEILVLDHNSLNTVPPINTTLNVSTLSMNCNRVTSLSVNDFRNLPNLQKLFLSDNMISDVHTDVFANQESLEELHLDGNQLSHLPPGWHQPLNSLRYLDLSRNMFTSLMPVLYSEDLPLRELYVGDNPLKFIKISELFPKNITIYLDIDRSRDRLTCNLFTEQPYIDYVLPPSHVDLNYDEY